MARKVEGYDYRDSFVVSYWKNTRDGNWYIYFPVSDDEGNGLLGNLANHTVEEHDDGTITVSPSILVTNSQPGRRHGFLIKGVWQSCGDDEIVVIKREQPK